MKGFKRYYQSSLVVSLPNLSKKAEKDFLRRTKEVNTVCQQHFSFSFNWGVLFPHKVLADVRPQPRVILKIDYSNWGYKTSNTVAEFRGKVEIVAEYFRNNGYHEVSILHSSHYTDNVDIL